MPCDCERGDRVRAHISRFPGDQHEQPRAPPFTLPGQPRPGGRLASRRGRDHDDARDYPPASVVVRISSGPALAAHFDMRQYWWDRMLSNAGPCALPLTLTLAAGGVGRRLRRGASRCGADVAQSGEPSG
jgi:hypothetical protein